MTLRHATLPVREDDDELRRLIEDAELPPLLACLAQLTGDLSLLPDDLRPSAGLLAGPQGGYDESQIAKARALCLEALARFRDDGCRVPAPPEEAFLRGLFGFLVGPEHLDDYLPLLRDELALDGADVRAPRWSAQEVAPDTEFRVAIIGAGMSGLAAAFRLQQAGIPFVVLEKNAEVGGTWYENRYPGCRVDVPNHYYSYSFAQKDDWPQRFSTQEVLLDYFRGCADELGLRDAIRFETEVVEAVFDEERCAWVLTVESADGRRERLEANAIVSAVGQLSRPKMPEIEGIERFEGPSFHSAEWDEGVELAGKRVAVIGTGASAAQFVPIVAEQAASLAVFQRTAPWLLPSEDYHEAVPEGLQWMCAHLPFYAAWYRFWLFWSGAEGLLGCVDVDAAWPHPQRATGPMNDMIREFLTEYLKQQCDGDEALFEQMLPDYPPLSKRFVRDNGAWPETLKRDDVRLVTEGIDRMTARGILLASGEEIEVDVIVYGTGFTASDFLTPMKVVGRGGRDLHETWNGDARAYLGITVPHFPNLFLMYGPNTNIVVNGSIIFFSECEVDYMLACLHRLLAGGHRAADCRVEVHDAYNREIDAYSERRTWGAATVNTWYRNARGRISQNWPGTLLEYWKQTRDFDPSEYELL